MDAQKEYERIKAKASEQVEYGVPEPSTSYRKEVIPTSEGVASPDDKQPPLESDEITVDKWMNEEGYKEYWISRVEDLSKRIAESQDYTERTSLSREKQQLINQIRQPFIERTQSGIAATMMGERTAAAQRAATGVVQITVPVDDPTQPGPGHPVYEAAIGEPVIDIGGQRYNITYNEEGTPSIVGLPAGTRMATVGGSIQLATGETVSRDAWKELPQADRALLEEKGIDAYNEYIEGKVAEYEGAVKEYLDSTGGNFGYWKELESDKQTEYLENLGWEPVVDAGGKPIEGGWQYDITRGQLGEMAEKYASGDITEQQWLDYVGLAKERAEGIATPASPADIERFVVAVGDVAHYKSLPDADKQVYVQQLQATQEMDIQESIETFIKSSSRIGGDVNEYNALSTPEEQISYLQGLNDIYAGHQSKIQSFIASDKIKVDEAGSFIFSNLSMWDIEQNPELATALQIMFPKDSEGNDLDIVEAISKAYPSYLNSADEMTDTMKQIMYYDGMGALSLWGMSPDRKFEVMKSWGLIPLGGKYINGTERYIPTDEELADAGVTTEEWKQLVTNSGGDWLYGMPVWSLPEGRLSPEAIEYYVNKSISGIRSEYKSISGLSLPEGFTQVAPDALDKLLSEKYPDKTWNELTEGQKRNVLELYDEPSSHAKLGSRFTEVHEWIEGEPIAEGQMYIGTTPYTPPDPTTGLGGAQTTVDDWAKRQENVEVKAFASLAAGAVGLGIGALSVLETAFGAGKELGAGNFIQSGKDLIGIPVGMAEFMVIQLPKDIAEDPVYGVGEAIGMFIVPVLAKGAYTTARASFRAVDPRFGPSSAYSTDPKVRYYKGSPYMTAIEFRDAMQNLQERQRATPDVRAVGEVFDVKIPKEVTEPSFTKVGEQYVIDGTKIDAEGVLTEVRTPRYHPSANTIDDVGMVRDTAKIIVYHVLPDGTREYLVVKDRAGGAYQLAGGGIEAGRTVLDQVLKELKDETNLTVKNIKELQPYLGKIHSHAYNGTRIFLAEVVDKVAFDRFQHAGKGIPEVKNAQWIHESNMAKVRVSVMPGTYDVLTGVGVKQNVFDLQGVDKVTDATRDKTWGDRVKTDRLPTEEEIRVSSLKEGAIVDGQVRTMLFKTLTPANINRPVRLWHFTHDYTALMDKTKNGVLTLTDANKHYNSFFTSPEPAARYSYKNISKGAPEKHRPALMAIDVMPSELIKMGYQVEWVKDNATGQYVWKIRNAVIEDEITLMQGSELRVYPPNVTSKLISRGNFKDFTATSITDNPGVTAKINLKPNYIEWTGDLTSIDLAKVKKVVFNLNDTLIDVSTLKLKPNAIELLQALKNQGKEIALWTHSPKSRVQAIFDKNPELKNHFDINDKYSVQVREDYAIGEYGNVLPTDTLKPIKDIKGDVLVDNNPNQIYMQIKTGNVGLMADSLSDIKHSLSGDLGNKVESTRVSFEVPRTTAYKQGQKIPVLYLQTEMFKKATESINKTISQLEANKIYIEKLNSDLANMKREGKSTKVIEEELGRIVEENKKTMQYIIDLEKLGVRDIPITAGEIYRLKGLVAREKLYDIFKIRPKPVRLAWHGSMDSPFKNISTSLKTKTEGLDKYSKTRKGYAELAEERALRDLEERKAKSEGVDEVKRAKESFKEEMDKIREEELYWKSKDEPYKIGVGDIIDAASLRGGVDEYKSESESRKAELAKIEAYEAGITEARIPEGIMSEEALIEEYMPTEAVLSEEGVIESSIPEGAIPEGAIPEGTIPEGAIPEGIMPEGTIPEGTIPEGVIPEGTIPEGIIPEDITPPPPPPPLLIIGGGGKELTKEQLKAAIGWKQGIMYKYRYPPWGQKDIINSRSPMQGIPLKEGMRSAYESIIRTTKGYIPPNLVWHMGMMDVKVTDADKDGQPEIHFVEREHRKGRGTVRKKTTPSITRL